MLHNTAEERRPELSRPTAPYAAAARTVGKIYSQEQGHVAVLQAAGLAPVLPTESRRPQFRSSGALLVGIQYELSYLCGGNG